MSVEKNYSDEQEMHDKEDYMKCVLQPYIIVTSG